MTAVKAAPPPTNAREKKKKEKQCSGGQKLGLVSVGEIKPNSLQWGAGAFPALAVIQSVREPALHFTLSWNPKGGPKIQFASSPIHTLLKPLALLRIIQTQEEEVKQGPVPGSCSEIKLLLHEEKSPCGLE